MTQHPNSFDSRMHADSACGLWAPPAYVIVLDFIMVVVILVGRLGSGTDWIDSLALAAVGFLVAAGLATALLRWMVLRHMHHVHPSVPIPDSPRLRG